MSPKAQPSSPNIVGKSFTYSVASSVADTGGNDTKDREAQNEAGASWSVSTWHIILAALYIGVLSSLGGLLTSKLIKTQSPDGVWVTATAIIAAIGGGAAVPILRTISRRNHTY